MVDWKGNWALHALRFDLTYPAGKPGLMRSHSIIICLQLKHPYALSLMKNS